MGRLLRRYVDREFERDEDGLRSAMKMTRRALRAVRPIISERSYAGQLLHLGLTWERWEKFQEALTMYDEAVVVARRADPGVLAMAVAGQAFCRLCLDDYEDAVRVAEEAVSLLEPLAAEKPGQLGVFLLQARWTIAMGLYKLDRLAEAVPALELFVRTTRVAPDQPALLETLLALGNALLDLDRADDAAPYAEEAVRVARESGSTEDLARAEVLRGAARPRGR